MRTIINERNAKIYRDDRYGTVYETIEPGGGLLRNTGFATVVVDPGKESPPHFHARTEEVYYILEGCGIMTIDGHSQEVRAGDTIAIPLRAVHKIKNPGDEPLRFVCATSPPYSVKDDYEVDRGMQEGEPILILSGTTRPSSNTSRIAAKVAEIYSALRVPARLLCLSDLPPVAFTPEALNQRPPELKKMTDAVLRASGVVVITPEYNGSFPGMLKHFIDLLPFPEAFERRPVCFIGVAAGRWGASRAVEQLQSIFCYRKAFLYPDPVFLPAIDELLDKSGLLKDPEIEERLKKQAAGFVAHVQRVSMVSLISIPDNATTPVV